MLNFRPSMSGFEVQLNEKTFGHIDKEHGFFTSSTFIEDFVALSEEDLRKIADKVREIKLRAIPANFAREVKGF